MSTKKGRIINLFAGPGTGKSSTCAALFAELKYRGYNTEMVLEYAKDAAWERRGHKVFQAQEYIFGKQHFRLSRVAEEVQFAITDSPIFLSIVYAKPGYLPSLSLVIREAYDQYENINILLKRNKPYNPKGRLQNEEEARQKDIEIQDVLDKQNVPYHVLDFGRENVGQIIAIMQEEGWI